MSFERTGWTWLAMAGLAMGGCYTGIEGGSGDGSDPAADTADAGPGDGGGGGEDTDAGGDQDSGDDDGSPGSGGDSGPPEGCFPGAIGCECLDGTCSGLSACIEGICTPAPPAPEVEGPAAAIAGAVIPLEGTVEGGDDDNDDIVVYEQLQWEQIDGPTAPISYEFSEDARAYLPGNAGDGATLVFRLSARLGDVSSATDATITVLAATPTGAMDESPEVTALGASVVAPAGNAEYWLGTAAGTLARAGGDAVSFSEELGSRITAIAPYRDGLTLIAQPDLQRVAEYNQNNNQVTPFLTELSGGAPVGAVSSIAVDNDDNVYFGTEDGTIVLFDSPDGAEPAVSVTLHTLADVPTVLALGEVPVSPEIDDADAGNVLYFGTAGGSLMQIGLTDAEVLDGPLVGTPTAYVSIPGTGAITGLTVDDLGNMWVAKGDTLHLVRRREGEAATVVRSIAAPNGLAGFAGLRADDNAGLVWIDPTSGRIATMQVYDG